MKNEVKEQKRKLQEVEGQKRKLQEVEGQKISVQKELEREGIKSGCKGERKGGARPDAEGRVCPN